jgi:hypothetical protein
MKLAQVRSQRLAARTFSVGLRANLKAGGAGFKYFSFVPLLNILTSYV